ncbi:hypothetical protein J1P26_12035 [Neobacillus sp. MM2021_6]|uniref:hypothetical protein n=1 Tax=Bacillaceae TaxID=186817 RepID=UPI00140B5855|nr:MULTISPECIES: hypothetical protein [Bacillaceae]MBO0960434.1 hypothetical protein [Neobacillus sp. MM2021_6]NHC16709.1 hypothetical protein [Bacillus sp. MM2020_4]WML38841.1 hypothetical protein RCG19_16810 [Neobacillus sp. OS1-2]
MTETNEKVLGSQETEGSLETSLDLLWKLGFDEVDAWAERFNKRDERFLAAVKNFVEKVKQNQENVITIAAQFSVELKDWEKAAREEFLATTTPLQHFFPVKSYEEINQVVEDIQNKTAQLLLTPAQALTTGQFQALDKYLETVEQYISFRKKAREKYIESVKKTTNVLYENQKLFVNLFAKQVKTAMFPFQKYMKSVSDLTKA